jgi:transcriptional regulator with XRE-family HTH domain
MLSDKRIRKNKAGLGSVLKDARKSSGYTQKALASELGLEYYTMISQMELGYISIPPALWVQIAKTCGINPEEWVLRCLSEYQPDVYEALFKNRPYKQSAIALGLLNKGHLDSMITTP